MKKFTYKTSICNLTIQETDSKISAISFNEVEGLTEETELIKETYKQLCEYFEGKRKVFDIPLLIKGTDFQMKVWKSLQQIPYGETVSYGEIAKSIGNPKGSRAVGNANNKNKIAIIIPCHRVIGTNGNLTGYAGGLDVKKQLLSIENNTNYNK